MKKLLSTIIFLALAVTPALAAKFASVSSETANIRSCGGTNCAVKWKAWRYTPLAMTAVSKDKAWVQVKDFEGHTGWIHNTLLGTTVGVSAKTDLNVRKDASASAEIACTVEKGYAFRFHEKKGNWLRVSDSPEKKGDPVCEGWVFAANVWAPAVK